MVTKSGPGTTQVEVNHASEVDEIRLYPITASFGAKEFLSVEKVAAPYFGIKAYGVRMNGYIERNGEEFLWVGKRSREKPTFPGMLDHLVAGGLSSIPQEQHQQT